MVFELSIKHAPVVKSCYGFATTAVKVSNSITPTGAVGAAAKGIILECTPPVNPPVNQIFDSSISASLKSISNGKFFIALAMMISFSKPAFEEIDPTI